MARVCSQREPEACQAEANDSVGNPVKLASEVILIFQQSAHLAPVFTQSREVRQRWVWE